MPGAASTDTEAGSPWATELLDKKRHARGPFSCGVPALDTYLQKQATQDMRSRSAATHVLVDPDEPARIRGYYTLTNTSAELGRLPDAVAKKLPSYPAVSAVLIGRLAVAASDRGQGLGALLLADAIRRAYVHSSTIGAALIVVEAKDEAAVRFYEHFGFRRFPDNTHQLFMSMREASQV